MRKLNILWTLLAVTVFGVTVVSCSSDDGIEGNGSGDAPTKAYLSLNIVKNTMGTRESSSSESESTEEESTINSVYILMLDESGEFLVNPNNENRCFVEASVTSTGVTEAIVVNGSTKKILLVANPNVATKAYLNGIGEGTAFDSFERDVIGIAETSEVTGTSNNRFTMVSTPSDYSSALGDMLKPLISVTVYETASAATSNRMSVLVERLAAKVVVSYDNSNLTKPTDAVKFEMEGWKLDQVNSVFYLFPDKILYSDKHVPGYYRYNYYTVDPNYDYTQDSENDYNDALAAWDGLSETTWNASAAPEYCIENTMNEHYMLEENATRILLKATYYPSGTTVGGDWFYHNGIIYDGIEKLQEAYRAEGTTIASELVAACNAMYDALESYLPEKDLNENTGFMSITADELDGIAYGGQVLRNSENTDPSNMIYWYQNGLNYYSHIIQHDNNVVDGLAYKYGVVRNNHYALNLTKVSGKGLPWVPEPEGEIEKKNAYLSFDITVANWIYWETDFEL